MTALDRAHRRWVMRDPEMVPNSELLLELPVECGKLISAAYINGAQFFKCSTGLWRIVDGKFVKLGI